MTAAVEVPPRSRVGSWNVFERRYGPIPLADDSLLRDWVEVKDHDPSLVWTVVEAEGNWYVSPGFHLVNRIGYVLCERPYGVVESGCPGYRY